MPRQKKQVTELPQIPVITEPVEVVTSESAAPVEGVEIGGGLLVSGGVPTEYVGGHNPSPYEWPTEQPPQDNDHVAPGAELFAESPGPIALAAWAVMAEKQAENIGVTVCEITHPEAVDGGVHVGAMSGIRLVKGDAVSATLSDGSVI